MNLENLKKLRDFIATKITDEQFDMTHYRAKIGEQGSLTKKGCHLHEVIDPPCGTVGCMLGWAPAMGGDFRPIETEFTGPRSTLAFFIYCRRVFGFSPEQKVWRFLFGGNWAEIDNTREGAVSRIDYILKNPAPNFLRYEKDDDEYESIIIADGYPIKLDGWICEEG